MPLKSIYINGFKSFAEKTTIKLNSGITGIVGPNGSGKSNITEAIRWAMGESSAKSLRGDSMQDVIFAGSEFRAPLNRAEVRLTFDNHEQQLKFPADQVEVTRRVTRNGESDFLINKKSVRLRDIHDLFMDSGLSRDSFSIISQGRVEQIFNAKADDRRSIIEEAAGVLHFKQQKRTASLQLDQTNENLVRINDLVNELKDRVEPLHEQSSLAKEYQQQKQALDSQLQTLTAFEIQELLTQKTTLTTKADQTNQIVAKIDQQVKTNQAELTKQRQDLAQKTQQRETLREELGQLEQKLSEINADLKVNSQSKEFDNTAQKEAQSQLQGIQDQQRTTKEKIQALQTQLTQVNADYAQQRKTEASLRAKIAKNPQDLQKQLETKRAEYIDALQAQTSLKNDLVYLKTQVEKTTASQKNIQADNVTGQLAKQKEQVVKAKAEGQALVEKRQQAQNHLSAVQDELEHVQQERTELAQRVQQLAGKQQQLTAQKNAIKNLQSRHDGYYYGVKNVLNHLELFTGIAGAFADLIEFPPHLSEAMIAALGGSAQNLVANSQSNAKKAIGLLKQRGWGRATFLPLDALQAHRLPESIINQLKAQTGFIGVGSELVKHSAVITNAVNFLLGNVIFADNLDHATMMSNMSHHRYRIVTLEGDILSPGGQMTGGARNKTNNSPLTIKTEIKELTTQITDLRTKLATFQQQQATLTKRQSQATAAVEAARQALSFANEEINQANLEYQRLNDNYQRLKQQEDANASRLAAVDQEISELRTQQRQKEKALSNQNDQLVNFRTEIDQLQHTIADYDQAFQNVQAELNNLLPKIAILATNQKNLSAQIQVQEENLHNFEQQENSLQQKLVSLQQTSTKKQTTAKDLANARISVTQKHDQTQQELKNLTTALQQMQDQIDELDATASRNYELRKNAASEQEQNSIALTKLNNQIDSKLALLSEDYSISYEAAIQQAAGTNTPKQREQLKREVKLHRLSLADIGSVNLHAIEEYEQVKKRFDFLSSQQDDLITAKNNLLKTMNKMDDEVKTRFDQTFKQINAAFSEIFPIMFGGGHAKLVLTDPNDLLSTGLEIIAQPPGKKLQQLSLLSGGERALTAITLLFAILKVDPVPFCILDEVEASLDDANVDRFAKFLENYDLTTQFIVITHRRGTMEQADQLYGVVMQESGVSKILSISLKDLKDKDMKEEQQA